MGEQVNFVVLVEYLWEGGFEFDLMIVEIVVELEFEFDVVWVEMVGVICQVRICVFDDEMQMLVVFNLCIEEECNCYCELMQCKEWFKCQIGGVVVVG